jgi:hypothetical protein
LRRVHALGARTCVQAQTRLNWLSTRAMALSVWRQCAVNPRLRGYWARLPGLRPWARRPRPRRDRRSPVFRLPILLGATPRPPAVGPPTPPRARPKVSRFPTPHRRLTRHYYDQQRRQKSCRRCDLPLADLELPANMPAIPESQLSKTRRSACLRPVVGKRDVSTSPSGPSHARAAVDRCSSGDTG